MLSDHPIVCTLTADEMPKRLAQIRAIGEASLRSAETIGSQAALRFRADPLTRRRLEAIIAAEGQCCAFLSFELTEEREDLVLAIRGPAGSEPVMQELVAAFRGAATMSA
jgi:hypothetical protein